MAFLAIRVLSRFVFLDALLYRVALVIGGIAAVAGVLVQLKALITKQADDSKERIESLKLN